MKIELAKKLSDDEQKFIYQVHIEDKIGTGEGVEDWSWDGEVEVLVDSGVVLHKDNLKSVLSDVYFNSMVAAIKDDFHK